MSPDTDDVQQLRPLLFSIAYRMLGSVVDAEDIVQETFVRYYRALSDGTTIQSPKAFLSAVTTRLSIDQLRSARVRRETYGYSRRRTEMRTAIHLRHIALSA